MPTTYAVFVNYPVFIIFVEARISLKLTYFLTVPSRVFTVFHLLFCDNRSRNQATRVAFLLALAHLLRHQRINFNFFTAILHNIYYFYNITQYGVFYLSFGIHEYRLYLPLLYKKFQTLHHPSFASKSF